MESKPLELPFVLGIDLGVQSLGWAMLALDDKKTALPVLVAKREKDGLQAADHLA